MKQPLRKIHLNDLRQSLNCGALPLSLVRRWQTTGLPASERARAREADAAANVAVFPSLARSFVLLPTGFSPWIVIKHKHEFRTRTTEET